MERIYVKSRAARFSIILMAFVSALFAGCGGSISDGPAPTSGAATGAQSLGVSVVGSGAVTSSPSGINCGAQCTANFSSGAQVTLTAAASSGYTFNGWAGVGAACASASTCTLTLDASKTVTATFSAAKQPNPNSTTHPKILINNGATLATLQQLLSSKAPSATRFQNYVDSEMQSPGSNWNFQTWNAALLFQVTGDAKYADFAVSTTDAFVASEEALIASGTAPVVAGDSYLDVGPKVGNVALVYDWCYSRLSPGQRTRWIAYMNQAVFNVWNYKSAVWGGKSFPWSGWSVNNPSNNYYYSFLRATMLAGLATNGENSSAQGWIDQFRTNKIANQLVPAFNSDLAGGGSREGTGYGTAMKNLFQMYDWWELSTGERIASLTPHTLASQAWLLHNIVPTLDFLAASGDQARESTVAFFDYHREYLLSLISLFPQERLSAVSQAILQASSVPQMRNGFELSADYLNQRPAPLPAAQVTDLSATYWGSGTGQLLMRSAWGDKTAAFSDFTCGPFTESHAHRDQGSFQIYRGEWLAPTSNIYTASGIQQGEEMHNLVRIVQNGSTVRQVNGAPPCNLLALADNDVYTYAVARITPIYNGNAAIAKIEREYLFIKPGTFVVFDRIEAAAGTQRIWTLNLPGTPSVSGDHLSYTGAKANQLDVYRLAPAGLSYQVISPTLAGGDTFTQATRRVEETDAPGTSQTLFLHVIGTNSSVSSAATASASGMTGAQIVLSDGRTVTVQFANGTSGGSLDIQLPSGGGTQIGGALPAAVVAPPVFKN